MNLLREGSAKVMFASEKGINNFTETPNNPTTRRITKAYQGTAKKGATNSLREQNQIESNPTGLSDVQWVSARLQ